MIVTVWKNEKESNERCITRFNKRVQASRKMLLLRSTRYNTKKPTKSKVRTAAIMRSKYRALKERSKFY
ncbi:hypothetical protein GF354_04850 [Candidatus Peregrinibacteria bacterium]|nr:hypothetical protein [Candidatus Peregrinibacteria bacterium]